MELRVHYRQTGRSSQAVCGSISSDWTTTFNLVTCEDCRKWLKLDEEEILGTVSTRQVGGSHYKDLQIQPWDVIKAWMPSGDYVPPFGVYLWGNALKYLCRLGRKGPVIEQVDKAIHYLQALREELTDE